ncbi:hypothetical protein BX661DRAFT_100640 [Kickxella alabastrina]|uniref:uncharacterized protein n=1 Tax=Kickxella alabastrina TaxID=61397 RepID=UPI00221F6976|nr:uncharacterized protein BX661DRAFT_100640 [Kickxella alabastrina]KAI7829162.1 hypothetical protein BX661DRAFT_100640 [Kickxella alabastrina]
MKLLGVCTIGVFAATTYARLQVTLPNSHTEWEAGAPGTIKWKPIGNGIKGRLSIELMEGSDPGNMDVVTTIAENIPAGGMEARWNVPKNFKNSNNYSIKIVDEDGEEYYGQYFKGVGGRTEVGKKPANNGPPQAGNKEQQQGRNDPRNSGNPTGDDHSGNGNRKQQQQPQQAQTQQPHNSRNNMAMKGGNSSGESKDAFVSGQARSVSFSGSTAVVACAVAAAAGVLAIC